MEQTSDPSSRKDIRLSSEQKEPSWLTKLWLLMWKNVLLRKRHWVLTAFEIILPTLLFTLMVSIRVLPNSAFRPVEINKVSGNCLFGTIVLYCNIQI